VGMGLTRNKTVREKQGNAGAIGCSVRLGGAGWVGYVISYFIPRYPIDLLYIYNTASLCPLALDATHYACNCDCAV